MVYFTLFYYYCFSSFLLCNYKFSLKLSVFELFSRLSLNCSNVVDSRIMFIAFTDSRHLALTVHFPFLGQSHLPRRHSSAKNFPSKLSISSFKVIFSGGFARAKPLCAPRYDLRIPIFVYV